MSLRPTRTTASAAVTSARQPSVPDDKAFTTSSGSNYSDGPEPPKVPLSRPLTFSQRAISQALTNSAHLANLLPTGTLLAFQLLTAVFTHYGSCDSATRSLTLLLLSILAASCFLGSFTDSVKASDGQVYYGIATFKGMFLFDCPDPQKAGLPGLRNYKIRFIDGVPGVLSVLVVAAAALREKNVVTCVYPTAEHATKEVLDIVPAGIGMLCSWLFVIFPTRRHGIGYPVTPGE